MGGGLIQMNDRP
jgi:hypothetical protein